MISGLSIDPWERPEEMLPVLDPAQIAHLKSHGNVRRTQKGEILHDYGVPSSHFYVVISGEIEILRPFGTEEETVTILRRGHFTGELDMISGRRSLVRARVREAGEVIEIDRETLRTLVQTDVELSDIFMRAFILRRIGLIARGQGDVIVVGSNNSAGTHRIREFLTRNGHPYTYLDLETQTDVQELLNRFHVRPDEVPVVICRGEVLRNPTNEQIADVLGLNEVRDPGHVRDVMIVGAGPAGLSAAVYAASEGLDALVLEKHAVGGQAGSSSRIENYLGFPTGISGQELAGRAFVQAQKFGAEIALARPAGALGRDSKPYEVVVNSDLRLLTRTVVIATGAVYRKLPLPNLSKFEGVGVYYSATNIERQLCEGEEVIVVGGANSAGQAAVYLAQKVRKVHILVRKGHLSSTMSQYLIRRIERSPNIEVHYNTEIVALEGQERLERVRWRDKESANEETHDIRHLFLMTGAVPNTHWLLGCLVTDEKDFIKTGVALTRKELADSGWPLNREPYLFETSSPGVFAIGDVRSGSIKRVASAVGEGSIAIHLVHKVLQE